MGRAEFEEMLTALAIIDDGVQGEEEEDAEEGVWTF